MGAGQGVEDLKDGFLPLARNGPSFVLFLLIFFSLIPSVETSL